MQFKFVISLASGCFATVEPWQIPNMPCFLKWKLQIHFSHSLQKSSVFSFTQFLSPEGSASPLAFNKCAPSDHWQNLSHAFLQMSFFQNKYIIKAQSCFYLQKTICHSSTSLTWKSQITFFSSLKKYSSRICLFLFWAHVSLFTLKHCFSFHPCHLGVLWSFKKILSPVSILGV